MLYVKIFLDILNDKHVTNVQPLFLLFSVILSCLFISFHPTGSSSCEGGELLPEIE